MVNSKRMLRYILVISEWSITLHFENNRLMPIYKHVYGVKDVDAFRNGDFKVHLIVLIIIDCLRTLLPVFKMENILHDS